MGLFKADPPEAPDPQATAAAQGTLNKETANYNNILNRYDTFTPYGAQTWEISGYDPVTQAPLYQQYIDLSPEAQATVDQNITNARDLSKVQNEFLQNARTTLANPVDLSDVPEYQYNIGTGDYATQTKQAQDALYGKQTAILDPQYTQFEDKLNTKLANQGINLGTEAYDRAINNYARQRDFAYGNARNDAILGGYNVQNQAFNQDVTKNNAFNSAIDKTLGKLFAANNQPLNQYAALTTGSQVNVPQFQSTQTSNLPPIDIASMINNKYQGDLGAYNASVSGSNNLLGSLASIALGAATGGLGGAALGGIGGGTLGGNAGGTFGKYFSY